MLFIKLQEKFRKYRLEKACRMHPEAKWYYERYRDLKEQVVVFMATNEKVLSVQQTGYRQCYDTNWYVQLILNGETVDANIVRSDTETTMSLIHVLKDVHTREELCALDMRNQIYYD